MAQRFDSGLIVMLPRAAGQALAWWRVEDGAVIARGQDADPVAAASFDIAGPGAGIAALLPATISRSEWAERPEGLADRQAEALAARRGAEEAIGGREAGHAVARAFDADGPLLVTLVSKSVLAEGLRLLADLGVDPVHVVPTAALAFVAADGAPGAYVADIGGDAVVVDEAHVMPAEPPLMRALGVEEHPRRLSEDAVLAAVATALAEPPLDMLAGPFARKRSLPGMKGTQWKTLGWLLFAIISATLLIGIVTWWRFGAAAEDADERALAAIEAAIGEQPDLSTAEAALDARLAASGQGAAAFSAPLAALYQAVQPVPQVSVRQLGYLGDGTLNAALSAPDAAPVNEVIAALQDRGFRVTAESRVDDSGSAVFDITVRGW